MLTDRSVLEDGSQRLNSASSPDALPNTGDIVHPRPVR